VKKHMADKGMNKNALSQSLSDKLALAQARYQQECDSQAASASAQLDKMVKELKT
jgi:hypothetical protein